MNRELGLWKAEDCALVLIDYQPEQMESIRSETPVDLISRNVSLDDTLLGFAIVVSAGIAASAIRLVPRKPYHHAIDNLNERRAD